MALVKLQVLARSSSRFFYPAAAATRWYSDEGHIREAGGSFSKREKAQEDQYFRRLEQEQVEKLRKNAHKHHEEEIDHHYDAIRELKEQIERHKEKIRRHRKQLEGDDDD